MKCVHLKNSHISQVIWEMVDHDRNQVSIMYAFISFEEMVRGTAFFLCCLCF